MTTTPTPGPVEVTPEDREALERIDDALGFLTDNEREIVLAAFARHRTEALASAEVEVEPVGYIIAEMLNRRREFERNGIVLTARPSGMSTTPLYTRPPATMQAELVEALEDIANATMSMFATPSDMALWMKKRAGDAVEGAALKAHGETVA